MFAKPKCLYPGCHRPARTDGVCDVHDLVEAQAANAKVLATATTTHWYDCADKLVPYRDVFLFVGGGLIAGAAFGVRWQLGCLVLGAELIQLARMMSPKA